MADFEKVDGYENVEEYAQEIDNLINNKAIAIDQTNVSLTGEANSQYLPFLIDRYYDGVDLSDKAIRIHYVNRSGGGDYSVPINVERSEDKLRFGWLVPPGATAVQGDLNINVEFTGTNTKGETYILKTETQYMTIKESLATGEGIIYPGDEWYTAFTKQVDIFNKRIQQATDQDLAYGSEIKDARVGYDGEVHAVLSDRLKSDLEKMYAKKNYELLDQNQGKPFTVFIGLQEEIDNLDSKSDYTMYLPLDGEEEIGGMLLTDIFENDEDDGTIFPVVKKAKRLDVFSSSCNLDITNDYTILYSTATICNCLVALHGGVGKYSDPSDAISFNIVIPMTNQRIYHNHSFIALTSSGTMYAITLKLDWWNDEGIRVQVLSKNNNSIEKITIDSYSIIELGGEE